MKKNYRLGLAICALSIASMTGLVGTVGVALAAKEVITRPAGPPLMEIRTRDYHGKCDSYELVRHSSADTASDMLADMAMRIRVSGCVRATWVR